MSSTRIKYGLTVFLLFFFSFILMAQEEENSYIREFPQEFTIRPYIYRKFTSVSTERRLDEGREQRRFYPNTPVGLGIGVAYKNYALNLAYAPPMFRDKENGKTKYIDFQYHYYHRKYLFDFYYQNYRGFYNDENKPVAIFPDIHVLQYGATADYVFNNKKFSYRAAFYCNEKQMKSAGSFQVGGGFYYNKLNTDTTRILEGKNDFANYQVSITGGYVHTWVFNRDFFFTFGVTTGVNLGIEKLPNQKNKFEVTPNIYPRVSVGYNGEKHAVLLNFVVNRLYVTRSGNPDIIFDTGRMNLIYVHRLNWTPPILKKIKILNR